MSLKHFHELQGQRRINDALMKRIRFLEDRLEMSEVKRDLVADQLAALRQAIEGLGYEVKFL